ncbi:MAG: alkaline phosphatase, partial [Lentisphaeraceae bacterium]|nr:alkaline phosphatase [Lentisphaeraceae bacterium]
MKIGRRIMRKIKFSFFLLVGLFNLIACKHVFVKNMKTSNKTISKVTPQKPLNIIFLIGDGMGLSQVSSVYFNTKERIYFDECKSIALLRTSSSSDKITDSAAAATAFATGKKTYNGAISLDDDQNVLPTIVEILSKKGWNTGLIVTSTITDATPACFYAHVPLRKQEEDIAAQLVHSDIDFFAGGGLKHFNRRKDGLDLLDSLKAHGFTMEIDTLPLRIDATQEKFGFLLAQEGMPPMKNGRGAFLNKSVELALDYFDKKGEPFFLMVEGSQIDWGGHDNDGEYIISEMLDFNKTLGQVLKYAEKNKNTLVVVTADHETGGFTLASKNDTSES